MYKLKDIYERYWGEFVKSPGTFLPPRVFKAVNQTIACRTTKLGVSVYRCPSCEKKKVVYHSCKNRFCPQCGYQETQSWAERITAMAADMRHHHVIFTLPEELLPLVYRSPRTVYTILFSSATWVLKEWFHHKHNLIPGIIAVLHTAGFALKRHVHLHMLVTGGGVREGRWHELKGNYLTRLDFFRDRFRARFVHELRLAQQRGELGSMSDGELQQLFNTIKGKRWVVRVEKGVEKAWRIVRYIGRYIKRPPFAEQSIVAIDDEKVSFLSKDYRNKSGTKPRRVIISLSADEFLRRLLSHVPLEHFHTVRYYGAYQGKRCRVSLPAQKSWRELQIQLSGADALVCPCCGCELVYCGMEFPRREYAKTG